MIPASDWHGSPRRLFTAVSYTRLVARVGGQCIAENGGDEDTVVLLQGDRVIQRYEARCDIVHSATREQSVTHAWCHERQLPLLLPSFSSGDMRCNWPTTVVDRCQATLDYPPDDHPESETKVQTLMWNASINKSYHFCQGVTTAYFSYDWEIITDKTGIR